MLLLIGALAARDSHERTVEHILQRTTETLALAEVAGRGGRVGDLSADRVAFHRACEHLLTVGNHGDRLRGVEELVGDANLHTRDVVCRQVDAVALDSRLDEARGAPLPVFLNGHPERSVIPVREALQADVLRPPVELLLEEPGEDLLIAGEVPVDEVVGAGVFEVLDRCPKTGELPAHHVGLFDGNQGLTVELTVLEEVVLADRVGGQVNGVVPLAQELLEVRGREARPGPPDEHVGLRAHGSAGSEHAGVSQRYGPRSHATHGRPAHVDAVFVDGVEALHLLDGPEHVDLAHALEIRVSAAIGREEYGPGLGGELLLLGLQDPRVDDASGVHIAVEEDDQRPPLVGVVVVGDVDVIGLGGAVVSCDIGPLEMARLALEGDHAGLQPLQRLVPLGDLVPCVGGASDGPSGQQPGLPQLQLGQRHVGQIGVRRPILNSTLRSLNGALKLVDLRLEVRVLSSRQPRQQHRQ